MKPTSVPMLIRTLLPPRLGILLFALASSGVSAYCQQSFFNFTPPPQNIFVDGNCEASVSDGPLPVVTATSPGAVIITSQLDAGASGFGFTTNFNALTTVLVTWFVADNQGHTATFEFPITFRDNTPPVFDVSGTPSLLILNSVNQLPPLLPLPVTDNCGAGQVTQSTPTQTALPPICSSGTIVRTWFASDAALNTVSYTQTIQILQDLSEPVIVTPPSNGSANCSTLPGSYTAWLAAQMAQFTAVDSSGIDYYWNNAPAQLPNCAGPIVVQFRAYDNCGLYSFVNRTFTPSVDNVPPVVVQAPKDTVAFCNANYQQQLAQWIQQRAYAQVTDACSTTFDWDMYINGSLVDSTAVQAALQASFANPCQTQLIGSQFVPKVKAKVTVNFYVYDACNNERIAGLATFAVSDTTAPVITGTAITTEECGGSNDQTALQNWINARANATATDICSSPTTWQNPFSYTTSDGQVGSGNFNVGPYPTVPTGNCIWFTDVTFRADDECGNIGSKTFRFRLADSTPPVIGGFADTTFVYCPAAIPNTFTATVTDNCAVGLTATYTSIFADTACVGNYSLKLRWSATDQCGNTGTKIQIIAVRDTTGPVFGLVPAPITVACNAVGSIPAPIIGTTVTATDACGALQGITWSDTNNKNPNPNVCGHYNYLITRRFVATDVCGNTRTSTQIITVQDVIPPTAATPLPDVPVLCQNLPITPALPTAIDLCSPVLAPVVQVSQTIVAGNCPDNYTIVVTWNATDVCGNVGSFSRNYLVSDTTRPTLTTVPPDITVDCNAIPTAPATAALGAADNCDGTPNVVFSEVEIRDPNPVNCSHWSNYQIVRSWVVRDACNNSRTYSQTISVMDNTGPVVTLRDTIDLPNAIGQCGASILPPTPLSIFDACSNLTVAAMLRDTTPITGPASSTVVCDTVFLVMASPNLPPMQPVVSGSVTLKIYLDNADAEGSAEYFKIYGENGAFLGNTVNTPTQCGNSITTLSINSNLANQWLADGQLKITLAPFGSGPSAVNPICPGRQVRGEFDYQYVVPQVPITITYSIDGGPALAYPTSTSAFLGTGLHTVRFVATDCAGNSSTSTSVVRIRDIQPPVMSVPTPPTYFVGANNCIANVPLPFPNINENCDMSGQLNLTSGIVNTLFESDDNAGQVPVPVTLSVPGLIPNAVAGGILRIRHRGDNGDAGEFFQVFDENNNPLSTTTTSVGGVQCSSNFNVTSINVTASQLNAWATNGVALFRLVPNTDAVNFVDWINPCGPLSNNWDGTSAVQATLEYRYAIVQYQATGGQTGVLNGNQTSITMTPGTKTITYTTSDAAGNTNLMTYNVIVRDTIRPNAICQNKTVFASVTGANPVVLTASDINNGSTDNCSGSALFFNLSPTTFTCNQSGQIIPVTLTVTDTSGNSKVCVAQVRVETDTIAASATANICEGGNAQLFSSPPGNPGNYTYQWFTPNGTLFSAAQNPVITNAQASQEGTYTVKVTGPTGCTATGLTQLQLIGLPVQPVLSTPSPVICTGQNINLSTDAYNGFNVTYEWYRNNISTLLGVTTQPNFTLTNPPAGNYSILVRIVDQDCASALSAPRNVLVQAPIQATVAQSNISVCSGQPVSLVCTTPGGVGITYSWAGQNGFVSNLASPLAFNATSMSAGVYTVTVTANGCAGTPASVTLAVSPTPAAPTIIGSSQRCEGASITLTAQPPVGTTFAWISPELDTTFTSINSLIINNVMLADSGNWKVYSILNGCRSALSAPQLVEVQAYPNVIAEGNTPLCSGTSLNLAADTDQPASQLSFEWTGPDNFSSFSATATDATPATGDYIIKATTSFGCSDSDTLEVLFVPKPLITSITSNAPNCVTDTTDVTLFNTVASSNGPFTYQWTLPNNTLSTFDSLLIPNASTADNGTYSLIVTDKSGCASAPFSFTLGINEQPPLPILLQPLPVCSGAPLIIHLSNKTDFTNLSATYLWDINGTPSTTSNPSLDLGNAVMSHNGPVTVRVLVGDCLSMVSAPVTITVNPQPTPPVITTNSPVCEGGILSFTPPSNIVVDSWEWSGPAGFQSSIGNPTREDVVLNFEGDYRVRVTLNDCVSAFSDPIAVDVKPRPQRPTATSNSPVCLEQADTLILSVEDGTQTNGAMYQWFHWPAQTALNPPNFATSYSLSNFNQQTAGNNGFYVVAYLDNCPSEKSFNISARFDTIPDELASAGNDFLACAGLNLNLNATPPNQNGITGRWSQLSGPPVTFQQPNNPNSPILSQILANNTYQFVWALSNGACKQYDKDTISITAQAPAEAIARANFDTCFAQTIQLNAQQDPNTPGRWVQEFGQEVLNITITNPLDPNTTVTNIPQGETNLFFFTWVVESEACGTTSDEVIVRNISTRPDIGDNQVLCSTDDCLVLKASLGKDDTGAWKPFDASTSIIVLDSVTIRACGLETGINRFIWETNNGLCGNLSRDTIDVEFQAAPVTLDDALTVNFGNQGTLNLLNNDQLPPFFDVTIISPPINGQWEETSQGVVSYRPSLSFTGTDLLVYEVCNLNCPDTSQVDCDRAVATFTANGPTDCVEVPTLITPNGDMVNDVFYVPCLQCVDCPIDNTVTIFNQWGDQVFTESPYGNTWAGTYNNEPLPVGTYFWVIERVVNGVNTVQRGFVIIQR
jgi:gliding motility-associated-like protein